MRLTLLPLFIFCAVALSAQPLINEFEPNPPGTDPSMVSIELTGTPNSTFSGFLSSLENDTDNGNLGQVDRSAAISGTFDGNGILVVTIPDLENPSFTFILSELDPGDGSDLDTDDDGTLEGVAAAFGTIYDAIGIADQAAELPLLYATQLGGTAFQYSGTEPYRFFRDSQNRPYIIISPTSTSVIGADGSTTPISDFDPDPRGPNTFGQPNSTNTALPVTLTTLTAEPMGKTAMVKWSTATESGNSHFVVERSNDGRAFSAVGRVNGAGDSNGAISYDFVDQAPAAGENYYRLRQVDLTGASTFYGPVMVTFKFEGVTAYPNPVGDRLFVNGSDEAARTTVLDLNGRVVSSAITTEGGIATDQLAPGTYLLRVESATGTETLRFVKQ